MVEPCLQRQLFLDYCAFANAWLYFLLLIAFIASGKSNFLDFFLELKIEPLVIDWHVIFYLHGSVTSKWG